MHAEQLMSHEVQTCAQDDSLEHAARVMWEKDVGCLVVVDDERRPVAMVTDRDIAMAAYTRGSALRDIPVRQAMSRRLITCQPGSTAGEVEHAMQAEQVRRVPVVDAGGKLIGVVTLGDLARAASSPFHISAVPGVAKTLAAIGEQRWAKELAQGVA